MINNRQQGRRRGRGNGPQRPGGGGQGQRDSGNRIDSRARGNAAQLLEKYKNMARDAQMSGDRVNTEYYLQFADHYFRVLADQRGRNEDQGQQRRQQRDDFDQFDPFDDFGDEGEPVRADEVQRAQESDRQQQNDRQQAERQQSDRQQGDRQYGDRQYGERQQGERSARDDRQRSDRDERPRYDRDDRPREGREDRQQRQPREERPRFERDRRPVEARDDERRLQRPTQAPVANDVDTPPSDLADVPALNAALAQDVPPVSDAQVEEAPRRRTRTRKPREDAAEAAPVEALGADRLPPALGLVPLRNESAAGEESNAPTSATDDAAAEAPKPRRRRIVRAASGEATPAE
ncbi:DUF4167 domain-containing protein [Sphingomonas sp. HHU CXW]|uniref:DUF4167 domain-containing protein n=1 Tax=Sphingomonas hominis TaxID=2741495 RepID=A0ABX2JHQ6_9SPHN|nr:DUF4167 domain-containing protein [Sphingomonas hominis]NTS66155.1 DUF4167 domain-containing protein [Sphingomonas hominis]